MGRDRLMRLVGLSAFAVAVGSGFVLGAGPVSAAELSNGWTTTEYGPLGPADRDLLIKVRLAGLWEMPAGEKAQQRAANPKVKEIGAKISAEHHALDEATRAAASK